MRAPLRWFSMRFRQTWYLHRRHVCLPAYLPACRSICRSVHQSVKLPVRLSSPPARQVAPAMRLMWHSFDASTWPADKALLRICHTALPRVATSESA